MSRRRDDLRALFSGGETPGTAPETKARVPAFLRGGEEAALPSPPARAGSGALKAMGLELDGLRQAAGEAEALKARLQAGETVVALDPASIDAAFLRDRMPADPAADAALEASLAAHGQQVPVLVRPKRLDPGRYEAVYGHRRIAALARLGRPVRAVVRAMDDEELVIAQGQENNARRDLSFIERARFAAALEGRGFRRAVLVAALGVHTSEVTRYLAVANALPGALVEAIGPAPKAGRPRWLALAGALGPGRRVPAAVRQVIEREGFAGEDSDRRFAAVLAAAGAPKASAPGIPDPSWRSGDDRLAARALAARGRARLVLEGPDSAAFARWLGQEMDRLYVRFQANGKQAGGEKN
jgi:ParB family chromosome partitioning protein